MVRRTAVLKVLPILGQEKTPPWYQIKTRMLLLIKHSATIRVGMSTSMPPLKRENEKITNVYLKKHNDMKDV